MSPDDRPIFRALFITAIGDHARLVEHALAGLQGWEWLRLSAADEIGALQGLDEFSILLADSAAPGWDAKLSAGIRKRAPQLPQVVLGHTAGSLDGSEDACLDWERFSRPKLAALLGGLAGWQGGRAEGVERAYDPETGLPSGSLFQEQARQAFSLARRQRSPLAAMVLRLDRGLGAEGPSLARPNGRWQREAVLAVRAALRESDSVGLMADGELGLLLPGLGRPEEVVAVGQRLLENLRQGDCAPHPSLGAALLPLSGGDAEALLDAARKGAARSLALGGDCLHFDDPDLDSAAADRFRYEVDMRCGLLAGQFTLHYQPQATLDGTVVGAEALLRWLHPTKGPVPPSEFIPFSEACGFIDPLSAWALRRALRASVDLERRMPGLKMSVNLSPRQFYDPDLVDGILRALREEGCPGERLCLEVTETSALADMDGAARILSRLRESGIQVALDDFGSGYASVGYLKQLPLDIVKVDRSLVQELGRRREDERIAELVITIAHQQGLKVIAEGVEDADQLAALRRVGCDQYQGYFMAKPQPLEQFENWLKTHAAQAAFDLLNR